MRKAIINALSQLAKQNRIFCSEAEFQFALAWEIKTAYPQWQIFLEKCIPVGGKSFYVDIVIFDSENYYYIELKYQTSLCHYGSIKLKNQAAEDIMRYDYLKDIYRLRSIANNTSNFGGGYAIILSNDKLMYQQPTSSRSCSALDANFRIHDRRYPKNKLFFPIPGTVAWKTLSSTSTTHWTKTRSLSFTLPTINTCWESYLKFVDNNGKLQDFRFLINEVVNTSGKTKKSQNTKNSPNDEDNF